MHQFYPYAVDDINLFKRKLLQLSEQFNYFCYLDSNNYPNYPYSTFGSFFAIDALHVFESAIESKNLLADFQNFSQQHNAWLFGFLSYDLKNTFENLSSKNIDNINNPLIQFFVPKYIIRIENEKVDIGVTNFEGIEKFKKLFEQDRKHKTDTANQKIEIRNRIDKTAYIDIVNKIKEEIRIGNIYELNFCQEYFAENIAIDTTNVFEQLNTISKAPFSCYYKHTNNYLMCASPERFLKKTQQTLICQPIKGTRKRGTDTATDSAIKNELYFNEKERSENIMIVDLVRNDMSRIATKNSVEVEELFGLYTFEQVHQLISTVKCTVDKETTFAEIIRALFPMGSMTGAPKIAAMQLIEKYEHTQRGLFSGCVGYITPKGNFDFNVVIRSILYNKENKYICIQTGSAITIDADAESEYEECKLKAMAMINALK
ncbi:MAG: anthranilate synthase component I family protein [Sphingobacteriales bacterium]|nr:MAG: anthranilate synthase component I family protein [Sphingobacteriales bacterium]